MATNSFVIFKIFYNITKWFTEGCRLSIVITQLVSKRQSVKSVSKLHDNI